MTTPPEPAFVVYAQIQVRETQREKFLTHILKLAERSLADETGCLQYDVIELDRATDLFGVYEVYRDAASYDVHGASVHFHAWKVVAEVVIAEGGLDVQTGRRVPVVRRRPVTHAGFDVN
ncbi:putative quinol monooxygenase [Cryobacterium sp. Y11]|uniref:putative quinol monooxygenase n=1 Tax=Cryobacterium sp. Y11 TaxID=2045016 RepID=UPI000CE37D0F|nr:putative quinol monooxygenase [Cryobacterium sp. Y11]